MQQMPLLMSSRSEEEVVNAIDNDLSVYAECSCGNSFYIETEDEQDNYSEW